jgi:hypothetical protein
MGLGDWVRGWKKHQKGAIVALKDENYIQIIFMYDETLKTEKFYVSLGKSTNIKYTSKDIKLINFTKKRETDGLTDVVFGKSVLHYIEIVLKNGSTKEFQTHGYFIKEAEEFVDKYFYN